MAVADERRVAERRVRVARLVSIPIAGLGPAWREWERSRVCTAVHHARLVMPRSRLDIVMDASSAGRSRAIYHVSISLRTMDVDSRRMGLSIPRCVRERAVGHNCRHGYGAYPDVGDYMGRTVSRTT